MNKVVKLEWCNGDILHVTYPKRPLRIRNEHGHRYNKVTPLFETDLMNDSEMWWWFNRILGSMDAFEGEVVEYE